MIVLLRESPPDSTPGIYLGKPRLRLCMCDLSPLCFLVVRTVNPGWWLMFQAKSLLPPFLYDPQILANYAKSKKELARVTLTLTPYEKHMRVCLKKIDKAFQKKNTITNKREKIQSNLQVKPATL